MRAAFLDRDGILNSCTVDARNIPHPPSGVDEVQLEPGAVEAVGRLQSAGYAIAVVTNQPDVARGTQTRAIVKAINAKLADAIGLPLDAFFVCYHDASDRCGCRKPLPGLLHRAAAKYHIDDMAGSVMVGDRSGDVLAGAAAGTRTVLIDRPYSKRERCNPDHVAPDLARAANWILAGP